MKKKNLLIVLLTVVLTFSLALAACGKTNKVEEIKLNTSLMNLEYNIGDVFSYAGLKVTAVYTDGTEESVQLKICKVSRPDMTTAGKKTIEVEFDSVKSTYEITVVDPNAALDDDWSADYTVNPEGTDKLVELSAIEALLVGSDRLGPCDVDPSVAVGGMVYDDKVVFRIQSESAASAKLSIEFDHSAHGGSDVNSLIEFLINGAKVETTAVFNAGEAGHTHAAWKCYQTTDIGTINLEQGKNTLILRFLGNGSNLKGVVLNFGETEVTPPTEPTVEMPVKVTGTPYTFEAEDAELTAPCKVSSEVGAAANNPSGGKFVGNFGNSGDKLLFTVISDKAEKVSLEVVLGMRNASLFKAMFSIKLNGSIVELADVKLLANSGKDNWHDWQKLLVANLDIVQGTNTIEFIQGGEANNFDCIILTAPTAVLTKNAELADQTDISIDTEAVKKEFYLYENFNSSGLVVKAVMSDDTSKNISEADYTVSAPDMTTAGKKTITVTSGTYSKTYEITVKNEAEKSIIKTDTDKVFTFKGTDAVLSDDIKKNAEGDDGAIGGITNKSEAVWYFNSNVQETARLFITIDDYFKGKNVSSLIEITVNGKALDVSNVTFAEPAADHVHTAWHCYTVDTELGDIELVNGVNSIRFKFIADGTNILGIKVSFEPKPIVTTETYTFEAEKAMLSHCMTEYKTGVGAGNNALVGDTGEEATQTFTVYAENAATVNVTVRIASGSATTLDKLVKNFSVNGAAALDLSKIAVANGAGASWYQWTSGTIEGVALNKGANAITMSALSNFDSLKIASAVVLSETAEGETFVKLDGTKATCVGDTIGAEAGHEGWINNVAQGNTVTFNFTAEEGAKAVLSLFVDHNNTTKPDVSAMLEITVNGVVLNTTARYGYCGGTCPDSWHHAIECKLGEITLKGENTITLKFLTGNNSNFNGIGLYTTATVTPTVAA